MTDLILHGPPATTDDDLSWLDNRPDSPPPEAEQRGAYLALQHHMDDGEMISWILSGAGYTAYGRLGGAYPRYHSGYRLQPTPDGYVLTHWDAARGLDTNAWPAHLPSITARLLQYALALIPQGYRCLARALPSGEPALLIQSPTPPVEVPPLPYEPPYDGTPRPDYVPGYLGENGTLYPAVPPFTTGLWQAFVLGCGADGTDHSSIVPDNGPSPTFFEGAL